MASWEPVDIDRDEIADEDVKWDDDVMKDLEIRFNKLREFSETLDKSAVEDLIDMTAKTKYALKLDTIELVANQIYDKLITMFNNDRKRFGIQKGEPVLNPIRKYDNFKLADDDEQDMTIVWGGDFNLFFDSFLDADGGNPQLKMNSLTKLLSIMSERDLCDLFRVRNPDTRRFTWRCKNSFLQRRL